MNAGAALVQAAAVVNAAALATQQHSTTHNFDRTSARFYSSIVEAEGCT